MKLSLAIPAALAALCLAPSFAFAEEPPVAAPAAPVVEQRVLVFGDGAARFHVERDPQAGRMTFRAVDPAVRFERAPVVVMTTESGPREVPLTAVEGQPGVWMWSGDAVRAERFDGTMRVVVSGKTYSSPLAPVWTTQRTVTYQPRYGGRVLTLSDCGASVEVVQDPATGTLTIHSFEDVVVTGAPVITVTETKGPTTVTLVPVEGRPGAWMTRHDAFKTTTTSARIRLLVNGQPCEAPLVYAARPGGRIVSVSGGPNFEVVRDPTAGHYTFYTVEETWDGRPYVVENPTVVYGGRTYPLTRVEGEPRAWRLVGLDTAGSDARDGQLNFTLFGKTLSTRLGLSGLGIGVR
jgi:hypothetical protein